MSKNIVKIDKTKFMKSLDNFMNIENDYPKPTEVLELLDQATIPEEPKEECKQCSGHAIGHSSSCPNKPTPEPEEVTEKYPCPRQCACGNESCQSYIAHGTEGWPPIWWAHKPKSKVPEPFDTKNGATAYEYKINEILEYLTHLKEKEGE